MFRELLSIGPVTFYTVSIFYLLAFFFSSYIYWRKGKEEHYAEDELFDSYLLSLLWGVVWSRIGFIALHFSTFGLNPVKWIDIFSAPGLSPMVGIIMALLYLRVLAKRQKWNVFETLDFASLAISIGSAIIWLGLFFDGTGVGNVTKLPVGINFPSVFDKRHPVQLYATVLYALLFMFLFWAESRYRTFSWYRDKKHSAQTGFLFCSFLIAYGVIGILLGLVSPPQFNVMGVDLDIPLRVIILFFGVALLYTRTGRSLLPTLRKPKIQPVTETEPQT